VEFRGERVVRWDSKQLVPLRVSMATATLSSTAAEGFTVGSTKAEVAAVQGPPTRIEEDSWFYGESPYNSYQSEVEFRGERVVRWDSKQLVPLRVRAN
jgi:hypothetical protein